MQKKEEVITRKIFQNAFIVMMGIEMANSLSAVIDGLIISRFLGTEAMAANAIAAPCYSLIGMISGVLATGMQTICSKNVGSLKLKEANETFSVTIVFAAIMSVLLTVLGIVFAEPLAGLLGAKGCSAYLLPMVKDYMIGLFIGLFPTVGVVLLSSILQLEGKKKQVEIAIGIMMIVNIVSDYMIGVICNGGMFGMGLATSLGQYAALGILLLHFFDRNRLFCFTTREIQWKKIDLVFYVGSPKAIRRFCNTVRPICINCLLIGFGGGLAMSAISVQRNVKKFMEIPGTGIAAAVLMVAAVFYG